MMEHRPADLLSARPYILLLTTPMTLTLTLESGGDVTGRAQQDLWRTQSTGDKEGRGQGHVLPNSQLPPWQGGGADRGRAMVLARLMVMVPQSCLSPLCLQG